MAVCYRHPSRETGVSCSSCGRPICPDCMTPTPVGMRCPECAARADPRDQRRARRRRPCPVVTQTLIAINVIVFLAETAAGSARWAAAAAERADHGALYGGGADGPPAIRLHGHEYWRLVTGPASCTTGSSTS